MTSQKHKEELQEATIHIPDKVMSEAGKGCVVKCIGEKMPAKAGSHGSYRRNGYDTIVGDSKKREIYNRSFARIKKRFEKAKPPSESQHGTGLSVTRTDPSKAENKGAWDLGNPLHPKNFQVGHTPYNHDYHHIMPMDCLLRLGSPRLKLLMQEGYNLNAGGNLIILPKLEYYARMVELPYHCDNHPTYLVKTSAQISSIKGQMALGSAVHNEEKAKKVKKLLEDWQKDMFWVIRRLGVAEVAKNKKAPDITQAKPKRMTLK